MDLAYDSFRLKDGSIANVKDFGVFKWFCSGTVHKAHTFGCNSGFVDEMYIFGEEAPADWGHGRFFALHDKTLHLISGSGSGNAVELQGGINGLPEDALENVAMVDTGETGHVVLVCSPDYGTKTLKLYVGRKGDYTVGFILNSDYMRISYLTDLPGAFNRGQNKRRVLRRMYRR